MSVASGLVVWRWVIRGLAIGLLTFCVGAWGVSYRWKMGIERRGVWRDWTWDVFRNELELKVERYTWASTNTYWRWLCYEEDYYFYEFDGGFNFNCLGFYLGFGPDRGSDGALVIQVPLYFATLVSGALLWLVWRKTTPKFNGRGFPIEMDGGSPGSG